MARAIFGMEYDVTGEVIVNGQKMKTLKDRLDVKLGIYPRTVTPNPFLTRQA